MRFPFVTRGLALLISAAAVVPALAQRPGPTPAGAGTPHEEFKNLKVLPKDIPSDSLRALMGGFTRALGVRCVYCHVGEPGKPLRREDFSLDDKPTKLKARAMLEMVRDINDKYLAALDHRADPAIRVGCVTCHHGAAEPRTLQAVLETAYATGGMDSTLARYRSLKDRYYGRFTYDFSEVPLADVAEQLLAAGHAADAESLLAFNVAVNPTSAFARRQHASAVLLDAFRSASADLPGTVHGLRARYGESLVSEQLVDEMGHVLLAGHEGTAALAAFRLNVTDYSASAGAYESLGDALAQSGDAKRARDAYARSLELNPASDAVKQKLDALRHGSKARAPGAK